MTQSTTKPNRLIHEKSPYLLQHAYNPVNWFAWGEEAFQTAKKENKPILLSIGYSTCHWCHVMEEECFSNLEIAEMMTNTVVAIKVDREERPDIDHIYMKAVTAMTGSGGWPLNVFLTHDLKPFYGGTYFPPENKWGRPGFPAVLQMIYGKWLNEREKIVASSEGIAKYLEEELAKSAVSGPLNGTMLEKTYDELLARFDPDQGGFGAAPKFPQSHMNSFLLRYWKRTNQSEALHMVERTLQQMALGGIHDQLGGGFHRYSTDADWFLPHFEKMLYDQAILARSYVEAYQTTGKPEYARIASGIFDYVLRDLTDEGGAFYSAEDADSYPPEQEAKTKKMEGAFYVWSAQELELLLGVENARITSEFYGANLDGNVAQDPHDEFHGKNILAVSSTVEIIAKRHSKSSEEVIKIIEQGKEKLFAARTKRPRPHLDDKILLDWNGLMIASLAYGSRALGSVRYKEAAQKAADFLLEKMKCKDGRLVHRFRDLDASIPGFLEDYAFFSYGLLELYEASFNVKYLEEAQSLIYKMHELFWDEGRGGFYFTGTDAEPLIARAKEYYDGALPSGNSVAVLVLLRASRMLMNQEMETWAKRTMESVSGQAAEYPSTFAQMMMALDFLTGPSTEVVLAGELEDEIMHKMIQEINSRFLPNQTVLFHPSSGMERAEIEALSPFVKKQIALDGKATAYVCRNYTCESPLTGVEQLKEFFRKKEEKS